MKKKLASIDLESYVFFSFPISFPTAGNRAGVAKRFHNQQEYVKERARRASNLRKKNTRRPREI